MFGEAGCGGELQFVCTHCITQKDSTNLAVLSGTCMEKQAVVGGCSVCAPLTWTGGDSVQCSSVREALLG